jgi:hypothetical protein
MFLVMLGAFPAIQGAGHTNCLTHCEPRPRGVGSKENEIVAYGQRGSNAIVGTGYSLHVWKRIGIGLQPKGEGRSIVMRSFFWICFFRDAHSDPSLPSTC